MINTELQIGRQRLLVTPGPTNVSDEVRMAALTPDYSHRDPAFREALARITTKLPRLLGGGQTHACVLFAGGGTGAMEAIVSSIRGELLVLVNGRYSERIAEIADRFEIPTRRHYVPELEPPDLGSLARALEVAPAVTHLAVVHHETTTGALLPLRALGELAERYGVRLIVDGISSVGGHDFDLVRDRVDYLSLNSNKCLESLPGLGLVVARTDHLEGLAGAARSFYFDLYAQWKRLQRTEVPYTVPVQVAFALDVALKRLEEETYAGRVERYACTAVYARQQLSGAGFEVAALPPQIRGNVITTMKLPDGIDFRAFHDRLQLDDVTIYSNATTIDSGRFFIATMGAIGNRDVDFAVEALRRAAAEQGIDLAARGGTGDGYVQLIGQTPS